MQNILQHMYEKYFFISTNKCGNTCLEKGCFASLHVAREIKLEIYFIQDGSKWKTVML